MTIMKAEPGTLRRMNERRILNAIRVHGSLSRTDLQRELSLALPTVSRIVDSLIELGWVAETGVLETALGRPPVMVEIHAEGGHAIGVDIGRLVTRVAFVNLLGEVCYTEKVPTSAIEPSLSLVEYLESLIAAHPEFRNLIGVGIAAPGSPNPHPATHRPDTDDYPEHHWHRDKVVELISSRLKIPAWIENDANAAVLGEIWFGVGQAAKHLLFVLADVGIGAGIAANGSIYRGETNSAGEFAHTIVDIHGDVRCGCGRRGCLGGIAPLVHLLSGIEQVKGQPVSLEQVVENAAAGVEPEYGIVQDTLDYLAVGVLNMIQILDPTMVVLGGATFIGGDYMVREMSRKVTNLLSPKHVPLVASGFGENAIAIGAATLALKHLYDHTTLIDDPLASNPA